MRTPKGPVYIDGCPDFLYIAVKLQNNNVMLFCFRIEGLLTQKLSALMCTEPLLTLVGTGMAKIEKVVVKASYPEHPDGREEKIKAALKVTSELVRGLIKNGMDAKRLGFEVFCHENLVGQTILPSKKVGWLSKNVWWG
jgi:hypothetical protein